MTTKLFSSILSLVAIAAVSFANEVPMYDSAYAAKTKEVMMLSQILGGQNLSIDVSESVSGSRGFFSSFSENTSNAWRGGVSITVAINNCISEEKSREVEMKGYSFKSRIADGLIVAYREEVKQLKKNGAKYIFIGKQKVLSRQQNKKFFIKDNILVSDENGIENSIRYDEVFSDFFLSILTDKTDHTIDERWFISKGRIDVDRTMSNRCFQDKSLSAGDIVWGVGQLASLALGAKGASMGSPDMVSLASSSSNAIENTVGTSKQQGNTGASKKFSAIATKIDTSMVGVVDPEYFQKNGNGAGMGYEGSFFPIEAVEEHLSHYMDIPYRVKKLDEK